MDRLQPDRREAVTQVVQQGAHLPRPGGERRRLRDRLGGPPPQPRDERRRLQQRARGQRPAQHRVQLRDDAPQPGRQLGERLAAARVRARQLEPVVRVGHQLGQDRQRQGLAARRGDLQRAEEARHALPPGAGQRLRHDDVRVRAGCDRPQHLEDRARPVRGGHARQHHARVRLLARQDAAAGDEGVVRRTARRAHRVQHREPGRGVRPAVVHGDVAGAGAHVGDEPRPVRVRGAEHQRHLRHEVAAGQRRADEADQQHDDVPSRRGAARRPGRRGGLVVERHRQPRLGPHVGAAGEPPPAGQPRREQVPDARVGSLRGRPHGGHDGSPPRAPGRAAAVVEDGGLSSSQ